MRLRDDLVVRHVGDDYVIVDPGQDMVDMSKVFTLNASAAWLWGELAGLDFTSETMVEMLQKKYEVSNEIAVADVEKLIEIFEKNGLLKY